MKTKKVVLSTGLLVVLATIAIGTTKFVANKEQVKVKACCKKPISTKEEPCVFMSVMGEQPVEGYAQNKYSKKVEKTISDGENWLIAAQNKNGGWGAGLQSNQGERDPHAVQSDPATTAMCAMALYRCGYNLNSGKHSEKLKSALSFLLSEIEKNKNYEFITQIRGTQIQGKLGQNIDAVLTLQFLNQIVSSVEDKQLKSRVNKAIQNCVDKIEKSYDTSGKVSGAGWAGVLQSSFANSALEEAQKNTSVKVDADKVQAARNYQKSNYDTDTGKVNSADGAGIVLYAVSSSVKGSAGEVKEAEKMFEEAKDKGKIDKKAEFNERNLIAAGMSKEKANSSVVANKVYESAKVQAMDDKVMNGFGNNGGEEFMSFLQTGESMVAKKDNDWKKWYDNVSGKMISIQNPDGSWNGHHCITSPAFCTATSLLILSIENDLEKLQK